MVLGCKSGVIQMIYRVRSIRISNYFKIDISGANVKSITLCFDKSHDQWWRHHFTTCCFICNIWRRSADYWISELGLKSAPCSPALYFEVTDESGLVD